MLNPKKMARIVGANFSMLAGFSLSKPNRSPPLLFSTVPNLPFLPSATKMGIEGNAKSSPEIKEPSPKIQKLHQNGVSRDTVIPISVLRVKKLSENAVLPSRGSPLSAGYDLSSATAVTVAARGKALVPTDLSIGIPEGTYARIAPRSGLAWKHSIDVGAGVIDADYRGPVGVILFNYSDEAFEVKPGDRIAQLILEKIVTPEVLEVDDLDSTVRGAGGFGSTGV
ncbi:deoxyuridine 5'-triphosphate nucleotidohydrolase [Cinnamomum micranthum f. kanehirae]|uniref:Deoxyuridine 5'-triphosphate nucleotidohydrolase n=1 Tax=Cinnamomum micranthum f. kanehirae TaxID=337451 RepID=A0A3S3N167_9MAGN|nr:deoxyuridine 5'-triphosphate nucleotidohydrolase [Cinnamomum micranthum f. kanehirae]